MTVQFELTNADGGEEADGGVGRVAVREERLGGVHGEGEGNDGLAAGPHDDALHPQPVAQENLGRFPRFRIKMLLVNLLYDFKAVFVLTTENAQVPRRKKLFPIISLNDVCLWTIK